MATFELNSEITVGSLKWTGVNEVRIRRSIRSYMDWASIKVPSIAKIVKGNRESSEVVTMGKLINDGDRVTIKLGYNGELRTEFEGFVKRRNLAMPLEIECEGYGRQMRLGAGVYKHYGATTVAELMRDAVKGTDITLDVRDNVKLVELTLRNARAADVADKLKQLTMGTLAIFFVEPKKLWVGLAYTAYRNNVDPWGLGVVNYRLGYNVVKDNGLKERVVEGEPVQVIFGGALATGQKLMTKSEAEYAPRKLKHVQNNIGDVAWMRKIANEKQYTMNYSGYEGVINGFLQPFCSPGYRANIVDARYPERDGVYMVEATEVRFGVAGARRVVTVGPKIGFDPRKSVR